MMPFEGEIRQREARSVGFRPSPWRRWGKRLVIMTCVAAPAAVALFACDNPVHLPGLQNELPNRVGGQVAFVSTGSGTGGTTTTAGTAGSITASDAGPALSVCDCAAASNAGETACKSCSNSFCSGIYTQCLQAPANECDTAVQCVSTCAANDGACISQCIQVAPAYAAFVQCLFTNCTSSCGWSPPESCSYDAGTD